MTTNLLPSLDNHLFVMASSTASVVDPSDPSRFRYHELDGTIWGNYTGGTVKNGRFIGIRSGNDLTVSFVHTVLETNKQVLGTSNSRIEQGATGLKLVEEFQVGPEHHVSVCVDSADSSDPEL